MKSSVIIGAVFGLFAVIAIVVTLMMDDPRTVSSAVEGDSASVKKNGKNATDLSVKAASQKHVEPKKTEAPDTNKDTADPEKTVEYKGFEFKAKNIAALRDSMKNGDDRAPKIGKHIEEEQASQEEIDDPDLYQAYEARQDKKLFRAYVLAAKDKIKLLEREIKYAKEQGMPEEQLQEGIDKLEGIKNMRDKLLQEYPDLMEEGAPVNTPAP